MNHINIRILMLVFICSVFQACSIKKNNIRNLTEKVAFSEIVHDKLIEDDYRWLEDLESAKVSQWCRIQDSLTRLNLNAIYGKEKIERLYSDFSDSESMDPPQETRGHLVYVVKMSEKEQSVLSAKGKDSGEQSTLFDPTHFKKGWAITDFSTSTEHENILISISKIGQRSQHILVFNVDKKIIIDSIANASYSRYPWVDDNSFIYRTSKLDDSSTVNESIIKRNIKNRSSRVVLNASNSKSILTAYAHEQGERIIISESDNGSDISIICDATGQSNITKILSGVNLETVYEFIGGTKDHIYFRTNENASNWKIIAYNLISEEKENLINESQEAINQAFVFGNHFVLYYLNMAKPSIKIFNLSGQLKHVINTSVGLAWSNYSFNWQGFAGNRISELLFYKNLGLESKGSVFEINVRSGKVKKFGQGNSEFSGEFITKQVFVPIENGLKMPMFITHKRDIKLDGNNPALLYVYGAYGWTELPFINPKYQTFLELGGIHVMPNVRGGGALGDDWYRLGLRQNKQNTIDDAISAAEWLIAHNYSKSEKIVIEGGSAGSVVAMAALNKRPELFGAGILEVPVSDLIRASLTTTSKMWKSQFGDSSDKEEFQVLYNYSPYHNIKEDVEYPPIFIAPGSIDKIANPFHAYKLYSKLIENSKNRVYLRINWGGDHNGGNQELRDLERIHELLFLTKTLGINVK